MSIQITVGATLQIKDTFLSANPNPVLFPGTSIKCPVGALAQDVVLPAATVAAALSFPAGVTTAKVIAIYAADIPDLIVTAGGIDFPVPTGQPFFLYNRAAAGLTVSSVLGGKISYVVGG